MNTLSNEKEEYVVLGLEPSIGGYRPAYVITILDHLPDEEEMNAIRYDHPTAYVIPKPPTLENTK